MQSINTFIISIILATKGKIQPCITSFMRFAKVELAPPSASDLPAIQKGFSNLLTSAKTGKYKSFTTKVSH